MMYSVREERLNALSHFLGLIFSMVAMALMIHSALYYGMWNVIAVSFFGVAMIMMYGASTCYHAVTNPKLKRIFRTLDHMNIYFLIAGTYTPIALIALHGTMGWIIFCVLWGVTVFGLIYKLFFFGDSWVSSALYIAMGWVALFFIGDIVAVLPSACLMWIILGGVFYTSGVVFYMMDEKIEYCHFVWHLFVLMGTFCHFMGIYLYIIPMTVN